MNGAMYCVCQYRCIDTLNTGGGSRHPGQVHILAS